MPLDSILTLSVSINAELKLRGMLIIYKSDKSGIMYLNCQIMAKDMS
jgi:hypothetical protein